MKYTFGALLAIANMALLTPEIATAANTTAVVQPNSGKATAKSNIKIALKLARQPKIKLPAQLEISSGHNSDLKLAKNIEINPGKNNAPNSDNNADHHPNINSGNNPSINSGNNSNINSGNNSNINNDINHEINPEGKSDKNSHWNLANNSAANSTKIAATKGDEYTVDAEQMARYLPSTAEVNRAIANYPSIQAAMQQVNVEKANAQRLSAGQYEWNMRAGLQQRKTTGSEDARFHEWSIAVERPLRLLSKGEIDRKMGALGVKIAEVSQGDMRHEAQRLLLQDWFLWLKDLAAVQLLKEQLDLLRQFEQQTQRRHQLGDAAKLEIVQAKAARAQVQAQLSGASARLSSSTNALQTRFPDISLPSTAPNAQRQGQPARVAGDMDTWVQRILAHNHEWRVAEAEHKKAQLFADRLQSDRMPDPTVGLNYSRERSGQERIVGAYVSIPIVGDGRTNHARAALAEVDVQRHKAAEILQKVTLEAKNTYLTAQARYDSWHTLDAAGNDLETAAAMTERAYQLGVGMLPELLTARRLAIEAKSAALNAKFDAIEAYYRLSLDAHKIWQDDAEEGDDDETEHADHME